MCLCSDITISYHEVDILSLSDAEKEVSVAESEGNFNRHLHCQLLCDHLHGTCTFDAHDFSHPGNK